MYSATELQEIQERIVTKRQFSAEEIQRATEANIPVHLILFQDIDKTNPELYQKIVKDPRIEQYGFTGFFPAAFDLVYGSEESPKIEFAQGNRGLIAILKHPKSNVVIKAKQSSREHEVAKIADELGVGPKQYPSLEGFISEEFVEGRLCSRLRPEYVQGDRMYELGKRIGEILTKLHSRDIFYNDTTLSDDFGRSHVLVPEEAPAKLFDYGVALLLDKHPTYSDEEVYNYLKTLPGINMFLEFGVSPQGVQQLIREYRQKMQKMTKEEIMARDVLFIEEGLSFLDYRISKQKEKLELFVRGFQETYQR